MSTTDGGRPADGPDRGAFGDGPGGYRPGEPAGPGGYGAGGYGDAAGYGPAGRAPRNGLGVAALVLGIAAIVFCWTAVGGIVLGVIALVLGIVGLGRIRRGEATNRGVTVTGLVLGIVGVLLGILFAFLWFFVFRAASNSDLAQCLDRAGNDQAQVQQCQREFANRLGVTPSP